MATERTPTPCPPDEATKVLRDYIVLALDQIETGPPDRLGSAHLVACLRPAMRLACAQNSRLATAGE